MLQKGYTKLQVALESRAKVKACIKKIEKECSRGLFIDCIKPNQMSLAELAIQFLLKAATHLTQKRLRYPAEGHLGQ